MKVEDILPRIKPRNKKVSDRYSANLHAFLSKKENQYKVHVVRHNLTGDLYLAGYWWNDPKVDSWTILSGAKIREITAGIKNMSSDGYTACWMGVFKKDCEDITEAFWRDYIRIGRCVFDRDHRIGFRDSAGRYTDVNNTKRCNWCGTWFRKSIQKRVRIERIEIWEPVRK